MLKKILELTILNRNLYAIALLTLFFNAVNLFPQIKSIFGYFGITAIIYIFVICSINTVYQVDLFQILKNIKNKDK